VIQVTPQMRILVAVEPMATHEGRCDAASTGWRGSAGRCCEKTRCRARSSCFATGGGRRSRRIFQGCVRGARRARGGRSMGADAGRCDPWWRRSQSSLLEVAGFEPLSCCLPVPLGRSHVATNGGLEGVWRGADGAVIVAHCAMVTPAASLVGSVPCTRLRQAPPFPLLQAQNYQGPGPWMPDIRGQRSGPLPHRPLVDGSLPWPFVRSR